MGPLMNRRRTAGSEVPPSASETPPMNGSSRTPSIKDAANEVSRALTDLARSLRVHAKEAARDAMVDVEAGARRAKAEMRLIRARLSGSQKRTAARTSEAAAKVKARAKSAWRDLTEPSANGKPRNSTESKRSGR